VELSIVLVILGLLTGGILGGQSLIRAAELRSVPADLTRYQAAIATFRDKYFALPGDMTNATQFWGAADGNDGLGLDCYETDSAGSKATCNGNGDGQINQDSTAYGNEKFRFWQHLANAGLIEGSYSGRAAVTGSGASRAVGINFAGRLPKSKISNAGFDVNNLDIHSDPSWRWDGRYGNAIYFGVSDQEGGIGDLLEGNALTPAEQWNIDTKMDDGKPSYGNIVTYKNQGTCNSAASQETAAYLLNLSAIGCFIVFKTGF
jgi:hypothetical protein